MHRRAGRALGVRRGPLGLPPRRHRLPRARVRLQPGHVRRGRRRSSSAGGARSSWPGSASTTSTSSTCTRASPRRCSSARRRSGSTSSASSPAPAGCLRRRSVEQLRDARHRHGRRRPARAARRATGWCGPTAATPPSTPSACTRRRRPSGLPPRVPQDEIDALPRRELAEPADAAGPATIEAYTVMHARDGAPEQAIAACLLADGRRAWGTSSDAGRADVAARRRVGRRRRHPRPRRRPPPVAPSSHRGFGVDGVRCRRWTWTATPAQSARTQRYTLGEPRNIAVSPDGRRIVFLRSRGRDRPGQLPVGARRRRPARSGSSPTPPSCSAGRDDADLPAEERARRERAREAAGGITAFATDAEVTVAAFALAGRLFVAGLMSAAARASCPSPAPCSIPGPTRPPAASPTSAAGCCASASSTARWRVLAGGEADEPESITWGSADFIAAEEMDRYRGYWWSPDGERLAVARVDTRPVPALVHRRSRPTRRPSRPSWPTRPPARPTPTSRSTSSASTAPSSTSSGTATRFPYLADVALVRRPACSSPCSRRDQRAAAGARRRPRHRRDRRRASTDDDDHGSSSSPACPRLLRRRRAGHVRRPRRRPPAARRRRPVTPADLQVRSVAAVDATGRRCSSPTRSTTPPACRSGAATTGGALTRAHRRARRPRVAAGGGTTSCVRTATLGRARRAQWATLDGVELASHAATPLDPRRRPPAAGRRTAASPPRCCSRADARRARRCPCCSTPTAAPTAQRVVRPHNAHLGSQWFADQGFAVVVADGRGTPGRGAALGAGGPPRPRHAPCSRTRSTPSTPPPSEHRELDLDRVAIRGWSFGGYLAALAVLRRPDVFHAAIAGAPVTEWRLYDTHYTERYLGDPDERPRRPTTPARCCRCAAGLRPAAAAHPRARRRQRRRRPHAAAVVRAARRRPAPRGAAAVGRHPHDAAGGRRREPPAAPARLPPPFARTGARRLTTVRG